MRWFRVSPLGPPRLVVGRMARKIRQWVATGRKNLAAHGWIPLLDHWPSNRQMAEPPPREPKGPGDHCDRPNIHY